MRSAAVLLSALLISSLGAACDASADADPFGFATPPPTPEPESRLRVHFVEANTFDGAVLGYIAHIYGRRLGENLIPLVSAVEVANDGDAPADVIVEVAIEGYTATTAASVTVPAYGTARVSDLTPAFNFDAVRGVTTSQLANLRVRVLRNGALMAVHDTPVTLEPRNRVRWFVPDGEGGLVDLRPSSLTLVTPDAPEVRDLIAEAPSYSEYGAMFGYQRGTPEAVHDQIRAVWDAVQARGVRYTSVGGSFFDGAQYVRSPQESLHEASANCVDGAFLFAAIFEALGMEASVIFLSGHALMAVRDAPGSNTSYFLETTLVATASMEEAADAGWRRYSDARDAGDPKLLRLDLRDVRELGLIPVP